MSAGFELGLEGKSAVVLGTGPAIGRACVAGLAAAGANVACLDIDAGAADASAAEAAATAGVQSLAIEADVLRRESIRAGFGQVVERFGRLDVLVNVVGGSLWSLSADTSDEEWDRGMAINLRHQWVAAQEALAHMIPARSGSIVMIASVSGLSASTNHGSYGAAKAGVINLARTLAVENGRHGVRVNAVAPGSIDTPARAGDDALGERVPLGRRGYPSDIGNAVVFLSSKASAYITGQALVVDGGVTVKHTLIDLP